MYAIAGIVNVVLTVVVDTEVIISVAVYGSLAAMNRITNIKHSIIIVVLDYIPMITTRLSSVSVIVSESGITIRATHS